MSQSYTKNSMTFFKHSVHVSLNYLVAGSVGAGDQKPDYEFNVWTKPDCAGTAYENRNRSVCVISYSQTGTSCLIVVIIIIIIKFLCRYMVGRLQRRWRQVRSVFGKSPMHVGNVSTVDM